MKTLGLLLFSSLYVFNHCQNDTDHKIAKRSLIFPRTTVMQLTVGLSVPVVLPSRPIIFSCCFQQNIDLPWNLTLLMPKIIRAKSFEQIDINREIFYKYAIEFFESVGLEGEDCLLRLICDVSEYPMHLEHTENLLERLVHHVLTPSLGFTYNKASAENTTTGRFLTKVLQAEKRGKTHGKCRKDYSKCSIPIIDMFTSKYIL